MKRLVVVESPTKIKKLREYLPAGYAVEASRGHVRDLPSNATEIPERHKDSAWARLGVDVEHDFEPLYIVPADKRAVVKHLKEAMKGMDELIIATDGDREGESIGWHLVEVLAPKIPVRRMVFTEITKEGIQGALARMRDVDQDLVEAQETRRILDRLVGYTVSPVLWRKISRGLSAGRVQSVAVRLVVERELERLAFVPAGYWGLTATTSKDEAAAASFTAALTHVGGQGVATGRDFGPDGALTRPNLLLVSEAQARDLAARLPGLRWRVTNVEAREQKRSPAPPFITSTLQQEAARKMGLSAKQAMRVAQALYEGGYITYMRTDSPALSDEAVAAARKSVESRYGRDFLSPSPRQFAAKNKGAQEAHEAIRPAGTAMKTARELGLDGAEGRLYDLIWTRTVASQMADARLRLVAATLDAGGEATFRATGRTVLFPGFFRVYVEGSDDPDAALEEKDQPLPELREGEAIACHEVEAEGHETKPPARFTESSLIKLLESEGVGRPSTYAAILDTIQARGYVRNERKTLVPTFTALAVTGLMEQQFGDLVDVGFTAEMETALDRISEGKEPARPFLRRFYDDLTARVTDGLATLDPRAISTLTHAKWAPFAVRIGKFGPYVEGPAGGDGAADDGGDGALKTASLPDDLAPADLTRATIEELIAAKGSGEEGLLGIHPTADMPVFLRKGPYGVYVQLGDDDQTGKPRRTSVPKTMAPGEVTLDFASRLLELPRTLGAHPETGQDITAAIGRFGPYVKHGTVFASLAASDDVLDVDLDRALELFAAKTRKGPVALRTLGPHPDDAAPVEVFEGRYGPYVKHGATNATLPKTSTPEAITLAEAVELIRIKAESGPAKKGRGAKKAAPKAAAAKKPAAAKKAPAEKKPAAAKTAAAKKPAKPKSPPKGDV